MKKLVFIIFATHLVLIACKSQDQSPKNNPPKIGITQNIESANEFYTNFRKAVLADDKKTIVSMTKFPFNIVFEEEGAPPNYEYISFPKLFDVLLHVKDELPSSSYELIKYHKAIRMEYFNKNGNRFSIGVFTFDRINDNWFLSYATVSEYSDIFITGPEGTPQENLQEFWNKFRQAVLTNNKDYIVSITSFPFISTDTELDPEITYDDQKSLRAAFDILLNGYVYTKDKQETMRGFAERNKTINKSNSRCVGNDFCAIGNFVFRKMMGKWYFTGAARGISVHNNHN